jgi:adenylosuccinate synthase
LTDAVDISSVRRFEDLPKMRAGMWNTSKKELGLPIEYISVGPERDSIIIRK